MRVIYLNQNKTWKILAIEMLFFDLNTMLKDLIKRSKNCVKDKQFVKKKKSLI